MVNLQSFLGRNGWEIVHLFTEPGKEAIYEQYNDLDLSDPALRLLKQYPAGIYTHQKLAISKFLSGSNICMSTSTASGKTLAFHVCAIEAIQRDRSARILAVYPLRALGTEQEDRWRMALNESGLNARVCRIDGGVRVSERLNLLKQSSVVIMTPDVIHAWLLRNISNKTVSKFFQQLSLVVIDEAHIYSGVFGSNSAFLFRRIIHVAAKLGGKPRFIASSATIKDPEKHLKNLVGIEPYVIDNNQETSPKRKLEIGLLNIPKGSDFLTSLSDLMRFTVAHTDHKFITFLDSRKQVEYLASITSRKYDSKAENDPTGAEDSELEFDYDQLSALQVYPYRSGYEEHDRNQIQQKLSKGLLRGVISTSALEMGIDIPYLSLGILVGIPHSATSFYQRLGRIGRHKDGLILLINNGSINTESIFRNPDDLFKMPLSESALYLDNSRIQYIHALCLARQGGEDDAVCSLLGHESDSFFTDAEFPEPFISLCNAEKIGEISPELQTMKAQAGEDPNHTFPLRDIDIQYKVEHRKGPEVMHLGSLSYAQVMREAYPGAVYYYQTGSFRVFRVNTHKRLIEVRREKKYTTKPNWLPTLIFPNLSDGNIIQCIRYGNLILVEANLQIRESIDGFIEMRGRNETRVSYPLDKTSGTYFDFPRFTRNYFTTGILFNHPCLNGKVKCSSLAEILYEAFLMTIPFERQDINFGDDKHRADRHSFKKGDKFISLYDQTYGSLRLTSRLAEHSVLLSVLERSLEIASNDDKLESDAAEITALKEILQCLSQRRDGLDLCDDLTADTGDSMRHKVLLPETVGINTQGDRNEEFEIVSVFLHPKGLMYKGKPLGEAKKYYPVAAGLATEPVILVPVEFIKEIPGESKIGFYNFDTGEIEPA